MIVIFIAAAFVSSKPMPMELHSPCQLELHSPYMELHSPFVSLLVSTVELHSPLYPVELDTPFPLCRRIFEVWATMAGEIKKQRELAHRHECRLVAMVDDEEKVEFGVTIRFNIKIGIAVVQLFCLYLIK